MGRPKGELEWHGSTLLRRTTGVLARAVDGPVLVVRAAGQEIPDPGPGVEVHEDAREGLGPLQGIAGALAAASGRAEVVFVCSTDLPFLHDAFVRAVLRSVSDDVDVALPLVHGYPQPLAAAYRTSLAPLAGDLVASDRLRPGFLLELCRVRRLDETELLRDPLVAAWDPGLDSVVNVNEPADYDRARAAAAPEIMVECLGGVASAGRRGPRPVRAATLAGAARAVGVDLDRGRDPDRERDPARGVVAAVWSPIDGDRLSRDGHLPLLAGDRVCFRWAGEAG